MHQALKIQNAWNNALAVQPQAFKIWLDLRFASGDDRNVRHTVGVLCHKSHL